MKINVTTTTKILERDCRDIAVKGTARLARVVRRNTEQGNRLAQRFARESAGPHGKFYFKRITAEMTGPLSGEYGPEGDVVGNAVGGGWRNGPPNTDLPRSADIQGPKFADEVGDTFGKMFW